jgi:hypothetical protein
MKILKIIKDGLVAISYLLLNLVIFVPTLLLLVLIVNIGKLIARAGSVIEGIGENIEYIFKKLAMKVIRCGDKIFLE